MDCYILRNFVYFFVFKWCQVNTLCSVLLAVGLFQGVLCSKSGNEGSYDYLNQDGDFFCSSHEHNRTCCYDNEFQCGDGTCIPLSKVCELAKYDLWTCDKCDCLDYSDEIGCAPSPCDARSDSCDQSCLDLPGTNNSRCTCYKGYHLDRFSNSHIKNKCEDINECLIAVHSCSHRCINLNGSFTCDCREGFKKNNATDSCISEGENISLFYTSGMYIYMYNINSRSSELIVYSGSVVGIDIDPVNEILYWSNDDGSWRTYIPGAKEGNVSIANSQHLFYSSEEHYIKYSLAVDWKLGNMYWLSPDLLNESQSYIMVSKLDGRYVKTMMDISRADHLVLNLKQGTFFWISNESVNSSVIRSAWMFHSSFNWKIIKIPHGSISVLTYDDLSNGRIYWADDVTYTIYYVYSVGKGLTKVIKVDSLRFPISMDVFGDFLYWVTRHSGELLRVNKFGKGNIEVLVNNLVKPTFVKVYFKDKLQEALVRNESALCEHCSHLCFSTDLITLCECPDGGKKRFFKGEVICESEQKPPVKDPLICNCNDLVNVCNKSSPYSSCPCNTCNKQSDTLLGFISTLDEAFNSSVTLLVIFLVLLAIVVVLFVLSFFKKEEVQDSNNPILFESRSQII